MLSAGATGAWDLPGEKLTGEPGLAGRVLNLAHNDRCHTPALESSPSSGFISFSLIAFEP